MLFKLLFFGVSYFSYVIRNSTVFICASFKRRYVLLIGFMKCISDLISLRYDYIYFPYSIDGTSNIGFEPLGSF